MPENKHLRFFVILLYIALGLLAFWFLLRYALGWFAPFVIAFLLSRLIEWPVQFMNTRLRVPRSLASGIWTILAFGGVGTGVYAIISRIVREIRDLALNLPDTGTIITQVTDFINRVSVNFLDTIPPDIRATIELTLENLVSEGLTIPKQLFSSIGSYTASAAGSLPSILLFIITVLVNLFLQQRLS